MQGFASTRRSGPLTTALALVLVLLAPAPVASARCAGAAATPGSVSAAQAGSATLCLVNDVRRARGLRGLRFNGPLATAARLHAQDMAAGRYFSHTSLDGRSAGDRVKQAGYVTGRESSWTVGENLAWGTGGRAAPRRIVASWMSSPTHRANILSRRYREVGLGMAVAGPEDSLPARIIYVTEFGVRR